VNDEFLGPLLELLRIPSVSTGEADPGPILEAAEWVRDYIRAAGASAQIEATNGNPLVIGRFQANRADAPHVLIYGHYDVQGAEPLDEWDSPPFEPTIRDGRIYARGASDDKGNFWPLLYTACEMHAKGELPVNVRALVEGEEENSSRNVMKWLADDRERTDAAIVYDSGTIAGGPTITLGGRGVIGGYVRVRVAEHDLHSGIHGGVALNALHVLIRMFGNILHGHDGLLRDEMRAGILPIPDAERAMWPVLDDPDRPLTGVGARPIAPDSGRRYFEITGWEPTFEVDEIRAGDPRTVIPAEASAYITIRLAPGQRWREVLEVAQRLMLDAAPANADVTFDIEHGVDAAGFDPESDVLRAGRRAFEKAFGAPPTLVRMGGSVPLLDVLAKRGIETIFTGFAGARDRIHAPNESYALESLEMGRVAARALYEELASLPGNGS
jgi:acetylornithine deacetylase/succinyl-diaminopimelate desuccinylase-like protein